MSKVNRDPREPFVISVFLQELLYECRCVMDSYDELRESFSSIMALQNEFETTQVRKLFGRKTMKDVLSIMGSNDKDKIDALISDAKNRGYKSLDDFKQFTKKYDPIHRKLQRSIEYLILHAGKLCLLLFPAGHHKPSPKRESEPNPRALRRRVLCAITDTRDSSPLADRSLRNTYEHYDERLDLILASVGAYGHRTVGKWFPEPKSQASGFTFDPESGVVYFIGRSVSQEKLALQPLLEEVVRVMGHAENFLATLSELDKKLGKEGAIKHIDQMIESHYG